MAPSTTSAKQLHHVSPIYKFYFLYSEPILALFGTTLILYDPFRFLEGTVPGTALTVYPLTITPVVQVLLTNIASLYLLLAFVEGVVLRLTRELNVWLGILGALVLSDIGHIYAVYTVAPEKAFNVASWGFDDYFSYGTLVGGLALRLLFIAGVGRR